MSKLWLASLAIDKSGRKCWLLSNKLVFIAEKCVVFFNDEDHVKAKMHCRSLRTFDPTTSRGSHSAVIEVKAWFMHCCLFKMELLLFKNPFFFLIIRKQWISTSNRQIQHKKRSFIKRSQGLLPVHLMGSIKYDGSPMAKLNCSCILTVWQHYTWSLYIITRA